MSQKEQNQQWLEQHLERVENFLEQQMPVDVVPAQLHDAMRYAVLGGGKRVRAALVYAAGEAAIQNGELSSAQAKALDHAAAAVELIHAYSLVHDDLPCLGDDELRRGRPAVHIAYDEATAMLVGDALQPLAFELLAAMPVAPALVVQAVSALATAAGSQSAKLRRPTSHASPENGCYARGFCAVGWYCGRGQLDGSSASYGLRTNHWVGLPDC